MIEIVSADRVLWTQSMPTENSASPAWAVSRNFMRTAMFFDVGRVLVVDGTEAMLDASKTWTITYDKMPAPEDLATALMLDQIFRRFRELFGWPPIKKPKSRIREFTL